MLTCLLWHLASVFLSQLDQEAALCSHNSGTKAQRIKCCVTLRKRNCVAKRACAQLCVCVRERARTYAFVWGLFCFCVYVLARSSNLMAVLLLQQDENKEPSRGRYREGGSASQRVRKRERFWISCYVTFSCREKQKLR